MLIKKIRSYKGLTIWSDDTGRFSVAEYDPSYNDHSVIADKFISIGEAMCWVDSI